MEKEERTWVMELTDTQFRAIAEGMNLYHAMLCGHTADLNRVSPRRLSEHTEDAVKRELFPELNSNEFYGMDGGSPDPKCDRLQAVSYQVYHEMLRRLMELEGIAMTPTLASGKADPVKITRTNKQEEK